MIEKELIDEYSYSAYWYLSNEILYNNPFAILYASFHTLRTELSSNYHKMKFDALGRLVGLTNNFTPLFMQKVVESKDEVKMLWRNIRNRYESANNFLYSQTNHEVELTNIGFFDYAFLGKSYIEKPYTYYELIKDVFDTPLLDKNDVMRKSNLMFPTVESGVQMGRELRELAPDYYDKEIFKSVTDLKKVYKEKDKSKREELANEYLAKWDPNRQYSVKRHFIQADFYAKFPLYHKLTKSSVAQQKVNMQDAMEKLCEKNDYEIEQYRDIFYSVAKMQDSINQVFGDQQMPPMVNDRLNGIHEEEKNVMKYGLLMLPAFIISAVAAPLTGGASLAAFGGLVLLATGAGSLGYLSYKTMIHSTNNLFENKQMYHEMRMMQELGFTDDENIKEFHRVSAPYLVIVDTFFLLPIVHYVSNMIRITYKSVVEIGKKGFRQSNLSHVLINSSGAVHIENSMTTLEFFGAWDQVKNGLRAMRDTFRKAFGVKTHVKGISSPWKNNGFRHADDMPTEAVLKSKTVRTVSKYFKGSITKFSKMVARYVKPKKMRSLRAKQEKLKVLADTQMERGSRWYNRLWWNYAARLEKVEKKIKLHEKWEEIYDLAKKYEADGKSLNQFLEENFDLVSELKGPYF